MDYDENDFQSQNFQLVGEDKFFANLRPFTLPRFDLDEHLRFDGLVEEEALLGIQGQENNWIDFPLGNSAIEFSSSAPESCSLASHNNIWSEATSSESVYLLLKSVGEDEMMNKKTDVMDMSANDGSHDIDNEVDFCEKKDDGIESSIMNKYQKDSLGSSDGQMELLHNAQCSSQAAYGQDSGIAMFVHPSIRQFSSDGNINSDPNVTSFYNYVKNSKADDKGLCDSVLNRKDACEVPIIAEVPSIDESNQDVKLDMETEKLSTEFFSFGNDQINLSCSSTFLLEDTHKKKPFITYSDDKTDHQIATKSDALEPLNANFIDSVFPVNSDGLVAAVPCQTMLLNGNNVTCEKTFVKEDIIDDNSVALMERTHLTEESRSICGSLEDDGSHGIKTQLSNNSAMSSNDKIGKHYTCLDDIDDKQDPGSQLVENKITDAANETTQLLTEPPIHVSHRTQETEIEDCERMSTNPLSFTCEKPGLVVESNNYANDLNVDRQELKLDEDKNVDPDESSLSISMNNESFLPASVTCEESRISHSTQCKSSVFMAAISVNELTVHNAQVSVDKEFPLTCIDTHIVNLDQVPNIIEKVQDLPPAVQDAAEDLHLDGSAKNMLEGVLGRKELLIQTFSASNALQSDRKEMKISELSSSSLSTTEWTVENESFFPSVSHLLNRNVKSTEKTLQDDSGAQLAPPVNASVFQPSEGTTGQNIDMEQVGPSSCLAIPDLLDSEKNGSKFSGSSLPSNFEKNGEKDIAIGAGEGPGNAKDTSTEHIPNTEVQSPSPVRSIEFTQPHNDRPSSTENSVGRDKTLLLKGHGITRTPCQERNNDILNSLEVVSHVANEVPIAINNLSNSDTNDFSKICTGSAAESNSSEAQSGNSTSSLRICVSPIITSSTKCQQDDSEHKEPKSSGNMSLVSYGEEEIAHKVDCDSNGVRGTFVEAQSFTFDVSTSEELPGMIAGSELSFQNLKENDIPQLLNRSSQGLLEEVKLMKTLNLGKSKNACRPFYERKTVSKGKTKKEPRALKQASVMEENIPSSSCKSVRSLSEDLPLVEMREHSNECCNIKTSSSSTVQTSSIPDLNSSSSLALFHQPFTDLQQVQLRAQIFVYGALISGMPPDEAYMVSAFGDVGRNLWEGAWRAMIVRYQNKKSPVYDTPHSRPIWIPEQISISNDVQSKVPSTSVKSDSIIVSSTVLNSTVPFPSPLWSLSYGYDGHHANILRSTHLNFSHTPSPLVQPTSVSRQHIGANSHWLSQSPCPGPLIASPQISALDSSKWHSIFPVTETVHVTPVRDSCDPHASTMQVASHSVLAHVLDSAATTAADFQMETSRKAATSGTIKHTPTTQKARKRKKGAAADETSFPDSQTSAQFASAVTGIGSFPPPSSSMLLSSNSQINAAIPASVPMSTPYIISPTHYKIIDTKNNQQKAILSEETHSKIEQAKLQAQDAAALAVSAVKHSQDIWSQLASQKNSVLVSQIEEKLTSAAVAAAAAASVAKAAAAAANVAAGAALQAKIMADEAMIASKTSSTVYNPESCIANVGKKASGISPVSILKGMDKMDGSGVIISGASDTARLQAQSASAAAKLAENLDAIVIAAELAAEAVAQAGTIITMGDPLPFTLIQLIDAGPERFWRGHDCSSTKHSKLSHLHGEEHVVLGNANEHGGSAKQLDAPISKDKETQKVTDEAGLSSLNKCHEQFDQRVQGNLSGAGAESDHPDSAIQKGSVVEVMPCEDGRKGAWFSAQVLDLNDNKAYVCYKDVSSSEGQLKEWIALENGVQAPRIRAVHSTSFVKYEGTRKRRREHLGSHIWEVGDHADVWIHDRWWEGTITDKITGDETKLTVLITARGDKQVVHSWNLRPSRTWKDGQWMEWPHAKGKSHKPLESDTPMEKRQRLVRVDAKTHSDADAGGMSKPSKNILIEESKKPDESRSLVLSAKDRTFSVGKNSRAEVKSDATKPKRVGLHREGSRVVFGVPRPGKKRKFMEVSKHYVANNSKKISEGSDSIKFAKYLMPQASRQTRNTLKVGYKGKKAAGINSNAENSKSFQNKSLSEKVKAMEEGAHVFHKDAISRGNNNILDQNSAFQFGSCPNNAEKNGVSAVDLVNFVQPAPASLSQKKETSGSLTDSTVKSKFSLDRTLTVKDKGPGNSAKAIPEVMEPRRSNRRIQPTSRLLEGIQSSLVISKLPSVSHERKPFRGGSTSRGNPRG